MINSSVYTCFWCPSLTFSIYTIQINIVGCCIVLDAKKNLPNAFIELLGMTQKKHGPIAISELSENHIKNLCLLGGYKTSSVAH